VTAEAQKEVYASLSGTVDSQMVQRIFANFATAINNNVQTVHLLVQSTGGYVGDGIGIYNFFRGLPLKVIAYNGGAIFSIAVIVFLGATERRASAFATFGIHKSHNSATQGNAASLKMMADALRIDDERTEKTSESISPCPKSNGTSTNVEI
jgi:ATP-dependent Clp protease protease subunit